jgi:hypothetical protein
MTKVGRRVRWNASPTRRCSDVCWPRARFIENNCRFDMHRQQNSVDDSSGEGRIRARRRHEQVAQADGRARLVDCAQSVRRVDRQGVTTSTAQFLTEPIEHLVHSFTWRRCETRHSVRRCRCSSARARADPRLILSRCMMCVCARVCTYITTVLPLLHLKYPYKLGVVRPSATATVSRFGSFDTAQRNHSTQHTQHATYSPHPTYLDSMTTKRTLRQCQTRTRSRAQ